ncbi:MAG: T9SS type A sorting domain-containing protein [Bacteroidales bacterium]|nr:T9SS type A sorting domain-containing protein [Bacteroidales bacterium]
MKKLYILLVALFTLNVMNAQNLTDSLLIYYPFTGNANDASGHGYNGTVYGATLTADRFGNSNSAYNFHGTDAYIDLPNVSKLKPQLPFSVSLWVYFNDLNNCYPIFTTDYYESGYTGSWIGINTINQDTVMIINYGDGGTVGDPAARRSKAGTTKMVKNKWYHVIGIWRGPTDMDIYIDCINDGGTYSGTGSNLVYSSYPGSIGRKKCSIAGPTSYWYLNGKVDEVRFWNRALTQKDIDNLCNPCGTPIIVSINGLNSSYDKNDTCHTLTGTPSGGILYGTGVYNGKFCPNILDVGTYNLAYVYKDADGCSGVICQSVNITNVGNVSEKTENKTDIFIYPNPANTQLTIEIPPTTKQSTIKIYNINGEELIKQQANTNKTEIDVSNLTGGVYFVKIINKQGVNIGKFVKE